MTKQNNYTLNFRRFIALVKVQDGCWVWLGARDARGYGRFHIGPGGDRSRLAHRLSFRLAHGYEPGEAVCHTCDNTACVNPEHLLDATRVVNNADMKAKGRCSFQVGTMKPLLGSQNPGAKLKESDVPLILARLAAHEKQRDVAKVFGVAQRTIARISLGIGWKHALPPQKSYAEPVDSTGK